MTDERHQPWRDALGAYLLGALPEDERREFEQHLETCQRCREDAAALQVAVDVLPGAAPPVEPPLELKDRIMAVVNSEAELLHAAGEGADRPPPPRRRGWRGWFPRPVITAGAAATAMVVGVFAGIALFGESSTPSRGRVVAAQQAPAAARASLLVRDGRASLVVRDMPPPPPNRTYQVWIAHPGATPAPAGATFAVRSGVVVIPRRVVSGERVLVTDEPEGGSPIPTRPPIVVTRTI